MNQEKMIFNIDCDNTLVNSTKELVRLLNIKFGTNVDWRDVKFYNCKDMFPDIVYQDILDAFANEDFFTELEFFDDVVKVLIKYKDYLIYKIPTIGTTMNLFYKEKWLNNNMPVDFIFEGIDKTSTGKEKSDMVGTIFGDDHVDNLRSSNAEYKILYKGDKDTDWNMQTPEDNFIEVKNWKELDVILTNILNIKQK